MNRMFSLFLALCMSATLMSSLGCGSSSSETGPTEAEDPTLSADAAMESTMDEAN